MGTAASRACSIKYLCQVASGRLKRARKIQGLHQSRYARTHAGICVEIRFVYTKGCTDWNTHMLIQLRIQRDYRHVYTRADPGNPITSKLSLSATSTYACTNLVSLAVLVPIAPGPVGLQGVSVACWTCTSRFPHVVYTSSRVRFVTGPMSVIVGRMQTYQHKCVW